MTGKECVHKWNKACTIKVEEATCKKCGIGAYDDKIFNAIKLGEKTMLEWVEEMLNNFDYTWLTSGEVDKEKTSVGETITANILDELIKKKKELEI